MILWKTQVEKLSVGIFVVLILTITLLLLKYFIASFISIIVLVILSFFWYRSLGEETAIHILKSHRGSYKYDSFIREFPRNGIQTISRLEKKSIVKVQNGIISLLDKNRFCAYDKFKRKSP